jgi:hypothetical protein
MKPSVSPHMVALLVLASLSTLRAESPATPTAPSSPNHPQPSSARNFSSPAVIAAAFESPALIPRAIPVAPDTSKPKAAVHLDVRREPVSFHPITVKNGPQPYIVDPDSLQKGLALISELYRKSANR